MFRRSFGAADFTGFWRHWNPFLGYVLAYFCFDPLRRIAPRSLCLIVTFALNGVLHDLVLVWPWGFARIARLPFPFPVFTLCLALIGVVMLVAERCRFSLANCSRSGRVACHLLALVGPFTFAVGVFLLVRVCGG